MDFFTFTEIFFYIIKLYKNSSSEIATHLTFPPKFMIYSCDIDKRVIFKKGIIVS